MPILFLLSVAMHRINHCRLLCDQDNVCSSSITRNLLVQNTDWWKPCIGALNHKHKYNAQLYISAHFIFKLCLNFSIHIRWNFVISNDPTKGASWSSKITSLFARVSASSSSAIGSSGIVSELHNRSMRSGLQLAGDWLEDCVELDCDGTIWGVASASLSFSLHSVIQHSNTDRYLTAQTQLEENLNVAAVHSQLLGGRASPR